MELFDKILDAGKDELEKVLKEKVQEGSAEGVLELLKKLGPVPDDLKEKIMAEGNKEKLTEWLKMAAKSENIEAFLEQIKKD